MKSFLIILLFSISISVSCKHEIKEVKNTTPISSTNLHDSQKVSSVETPLLVFVHDTIPCDTVREKDTALMAQIIRQQKTIDSLKTKLFVAKYKIERIRYYYQIAQKNQNKSSYFKFLLSWLQRTLKD